jgi:5-methylcytosine-specific restriction endonuclease McrA
MKRIPISLTKEEHELLRLESERLGISRAEIIRLLLKQFKRKNGLRNKITLRPLTRDEWSEAVKKRDKNICQICRDDKSIMYSHHILPTKKGGKNIIDNGLTVCMSCHGFLHQTIGNEYLGYTKEPLKKLTLREYFESLTETLETKG